MCMLRRISYLYLFAVVSVLSSDKTLVAQDAPTVGTTDVAIVDVSPRHEFVGRIEAVNSVDIRSRIQGFIERRAFDEGQTVKKGQDLFAIEPRSYEIALSDAQASLASARATLEDAERRLQRNQSLSSQTVARATLEESQTARDTALANVASAEASVQQAELNLSYTIISSPIDGRIGAAAFSVGSLVTASSEPLARVVEMDPIRVVFSVSDRTILDLREAAGGLSKDQLGARFVPRLRLSNGQEYEQSGTIAFFGNEVDEQTGTLAIRAMFPNPQSLLVPGQFVTVVVAEAKQEMRPVVPLGAVQQDRDGKFVFLVGQNDHVVMRRIKVSDQSGGNWVVDEGLEGGERLIVEGLQNVAEGSSVKVERASNANQTLGTSTPDRSQPGIVQ